ncbi:MAG: hypothetical protein NC180_01370 [Muribaculaceae bacterium]|nr:hypothetical protein [Roseburia sp.]MCM1431423.1 hypothetical protein [Muribaculaceae bacterium]MCM1491865.1 hypothetical protein [Muribaculaceae bacterium]
MDNNNNHGDYTSPEPYNPDAQYGFSKDNSQQGSSYQNGTDYTNGGSSGSAYQNGTDYTNGGSSGSAYQNGTDYTNGSSSYGSPYQNSSGSYGSPYQNGTDYTNGGNGGSAYQNGSYNNSGTYGSSYNYGGGNAYNQYNPQGPAPVDKNGRTLPNNFGMKLTFAILEIALSLITCLMGFWCFMLAPLVLSVIACIMVCMQNSAYKAGNWNSFVSKKKASTALLWVSFAIELLMIILLVVLVVLVILGVGVFGEALENMGYDNFWDYFEAYEASGGEGLTDEEMDRIIENLTGGESSDTDGGYNNYSLQSGEHLYIEGFNSFTLNGADVELPMKMKEFTKAGFTLDEADLDYVLEPRSYDGFAYYTSDGYYLGTLFVYNVSDEEKKVSKGIVGGLTINDSGEGVDLSMVKGITFGSTPDEAVAVLGNPTGMDGGDSYLDLEWYMYNDYGSSLQLQYSQNSLYEVWIMNDAELKAQIY